MIDLPLSYVSWFISPHPYVPWFIHGIQFLSELSASIDLA
jgi:uncharacterized protein (DUF3820 family)